jgi:hypothetical protein
MNGSTKRSAPGRLITGARNLRLDQDYHAPERVQAGLVVWPLEAARLASEHLRTGEEKHRAALRRHIEGMLMRLRRDAV